MYSPPFHGRPSFVVLTITAAPSAEPSSAAAGWAQNSSNGVSRRIRPFMTLLRATPPAVTSRVSPVALASQRAACRPTRSRVSCSA
ncbi:hypothetical protein R8Z50_18050 [Longispora sp. K20-0274]